MKAEIILVGPELLARFAELVKIFRETAAHLDRESMELLALFFGYLRREGVEVVLQDSFAHAVVPFLPPCLSSGFRASQLYDFRERYGTGLRSLFLIG